MTENEQYSEDWVNINVMVNKSTGELQAIAGDRDSLKGDAPFTGLEIIKKWKKRAESAKIHTANVAVNSYFKGIEDCINQLTKTFSTPTLRQLTKHIIPYSIPSVTTTLGMLCIYPNPLVPALLFIFIIE